MRKTLICLIVVVALLLVCSVGALTYYVWYQNNHVFVDDTVYDKSLTFLDLRGTGVSMEYYEAVRAQLPDCEIRYDLPFQGGFYPDDTKELTLTSLTDAEVELLDYLPELTAVHAEGCRDYPQLRALQERRPDCNVSYTVSLYGTEYPWDTEELSFGSETVDIQELSAGLAAMPRMKRVFFNQPSAPAEALTALKDTFPEISFRWEKDAFGTTYSSDVTEIDLTGMQFNAPEDVVEELKYFPALEKVIMSECGPTQKEWFDNETMAAFREKMRPEYKVVWTVRINNMKARTDDTYFMPNKYGQVVTNYHVQNLKYCEDMLCVDLGHMDVFDISFLEGMKNLQYFILVDSRLIYIEPIANCKNLIYVELFRTEIQDLSPLLGCTSLQDLNVTRTKADPMVLKEMTWLKNLWVSKHQFRSEADMQALQEALPDTFIKFSDYNLLARNGWRDLPNYFAMRDLLGMPYNTW